MSLGVSGSQLRIGKRDSVASIRTHASAPGPGRGTSTEDHVRGVREAAAASVANRRRKNAPPATVASGTVTRTGRKVAQRSQPATTTQSWAGGIANERLGDSARFLPAAAVSTGVSHAGLTGMDGSKPRPISQPIHRSAHSGSRDSKPTISQTTTSVVRHTPAPVVSASSVTSPSLPLPSNGGHSHSPLCSNPHPSRHVNEEPSSSHARHPPSSEHKPAARESHGNRRPGNSQASQYSDYTQQAAPASPPPESPSHMTGYSEDVPSGFAAILRPSSGLDAPSSKCLTTTQQPSSDWSVTGTNSPPAPLSASASAPVATTMAFARSSESVTSSHRNQAATDIQRWYRSQLECAPNSYPADGRSWRQKPSSRQARLGEGGAKGNGLADVEATDGVTDDSLKKLLAAKKEALLQQKQQKKERMNAENGKHAREAMQASQRKAAIVAMKEKRKEQADQEAFQKAQILKEEMARVEAKQKEKASRRRDRHRDHGNPTARLTPRHRNSGENQGHAAATPAAAEEIETVSDAESAQSSAVNLSQSPVISTAPPVSKTHADLLAMLEMLESEETDTSGPPSMTSSRRRQSSSMTSSQRSHRSPTKQESGDATSVLSGRFNEHDSNGAEQDGHMQSILTYLETVEHNTDQQPAAAANRSQDMAASSSTALTSDFAAAEAMATANMTTFLQRQRELLGQIEQGRSREDELKLVQEELERQKDLTMHIVQSQEDEMKGIQRKVGKQSQEYDTRIKKLLVKNDQLVADNNELQEQCRKLMSEMKDRERRHEQRFGTATESHEKELKRQKDVIMAAESMKREKWKADNAKRIKEVTVKGLEPEIQRLIAKHKSELREQASSYEGKIRAADDRAGRRYVAELEGLKVRLNVEKESACAKERELARQRFEGQLADEENAMQQRIRRLYSDMEESKKVFEGEQQQLTQQLKEKEKLQKRAQEQAVHQMEMESEKMLDEQHRRHQNEIAKVVERMTIERDAWKENFLKDEDRELAAKERELRKNVRKERDKEIEMVVVRLEMEMAESQKQHDQQAAARINRLREQFQAEMKSAERSERDAIERYADMKVQLSDSKAASARLQVDLAQRSAELEETKKVLSRLSDERQNVTDIVRQDFANRLVSTEEENKRIKTELAELTARHAYQLKRAEEEKKAIEDRLAEEKVEEIAKLHEDKSGEMAALHDRIKQAVAKKDDIIASLRTDVMTANKKAEHLNSLLQQQRKIMTTRK